MQQTNGVAILATQLATTDRRALSQAWYSALHLVERDGRGRPRERRRVARTADAPRRHTEMRDEGRLRQRGGTLATRTVTQRRATPLPDAERRAPKSELARRIERALVRRRPAHGTASFAIGAPDGRVQILVRSAGDRTRVVALCAPALRERVERALAHARYALAAHRVLTEAA
jgi:hypothetical protein